MSEPTIYIERGEIEDLEVEVSGQYTNYKGEDEERLGNRFEDITARVARDCEPYQEGDNIELTAAELKQAEEELMLAREINLADRILDVETSDLDYFLSRCNYHGLR